MDWRGWGDGVEGDVVEDGSDRLFLGGFLFEDGD